MREIGVPSRTRTSDIMINSHALWRVGGVIFVYSHLPEFLIPYFIPTEAMSLCDLSQIDQQNIIVFRCFLDHSIGKPTL